jgi:hypothetical protein
MFPMSISSVTASQPVKMPEASEQKAPEVRTDGGSSRTPQPTVLAPLPPGQGTRIDQLV